MPKVSIKKTSSLSAQETFHLVTKLLNNDSDLRKLDPKYSCDFNDSNLTGQAKGSQFKADMSVKSTSQGSEVEIIVDLPFHLALVKGLVEKTLIKKIDEALS
ncbi:MAG: hypothetical protein H6625_06610 [Bdellovibrionaceae bacterium]|nr:hypothetical protein [Pseudobdellovibrionaceae bacterium]